MKAKTGGSNRAVLIILTACVLSEILVFVFTPKFAYMQGLLESWYAKNGLLFYKDMANAYLPFLKFLMYWFHEVFGYSLIGSVLLAPITSIGLLFVIFNISRKYLKGIYATIPVIFFEVWNNYLGGNQFSTTLFLALLLFLTFASWLFWWQNQKKIYAFSFGILSSLSILTLQIVAPFIAALCLFALIKCVKDGRAMHAVWIAAGIFLPTVLVINWAVRHGILENFLYWNLFYYFGGYPYSKLGKDLSSVIIFFAVHSPILFLIGGSLGKNKNFPALGILASVLALMASFWFAVFHPMRFQISLPIMALIFGLGVRDFLSGKRNLARNFVFGLIVGINVFVIFYYIIPHYRVSFSTRNTNRIISEIYPGDPMYDTVLWVKNNTETSSKVFVLGDTYFYLAAGRLPANYRSALGVEPIIFYPLQKFREEIGNRPPDYWIIDERLFLTYSNWGQDGVSKVIKSFLACRKLIRRFDYWAIYGRSLENSSCVDNN